MKDRPDPTLDRLGAVSGVVAVILLLALFMVFPSLPAPDHRIGEIASSARANRDALLGGAYVGALFAGTLIVFRRVRGCEAASG